MAVISVIVPLYNTDKYLHRCVDSILAQTYSEFELILVNDGSTDRSGAICDEYACKDSRVHVIHKENNGVGAARNTGLEWVMENSDSQWIAFVDSDDWVHPEMLERLLDAAIEKNAKISVCGYLETDCEELVVTEDLLEAELWTPAEFYQKRYIHATVPWSKLYAKSCFKTIRYPVGTYVDDEFVTYKLLFEQEFLPVIPAALYAYYINPMGITKKPWVPKRLDAWKAYEEQIIFFEQRGEEALVRFRYRDYLENAFFNLQSAREAPNAGDLTEEIKGIRKSLRALIRRAWKRGYIAFWMDYIMLYECYPFLTRTYRIWKELRKQ